MYRPNADFFDRSNKRGRIINMNQVYNHYKKRVCANHLTANWGVKSDGTYWTNCRHGFLKNEPCKILCEHENTINLDNGQVGCTDCEKVLKEGEYGK